MATWTEWTPIDDQAYMNIAWIAQHTENCEYLWDRLKVYAPSWPVVAVGNPSMADAKSMPYPNRINIIEANTYNLVDGWLWDMSSYVGARRTWLGEWQDDGQGLLDYNDVNRWFLTLELLKSTIDYAEDNGRVAPNFYAGGDRTTQRIRRA